MPERIFPILPGGILNDFWEIFLLPDEMSRKLLVDALRGEGRLNEFRRAVVLKEELRGLPEGLFFQGMDPASLPLKNFSAACILAGMPENFLPGLNFFMFSLSFPGDLS
jgi:hypothetical protein